MKPIYILIAFILLMTFVDKGNANTETWNWTKETWKKYEIMRSIGYDDPLAKVIINECKEKAKNPAHCVKVASAIGKAESSCGNNSLNNNVFWIYRAKYKTRTHAVKDWVHRYTKFWYKTTGAHDFYSNTPTRQPKTWYCHSEPSTKSYWYCPAWYKIASSVFSKLD